MEEGEIFRYESLMRMLNFDEEIYFATAQHDLGSIFPTLHTLDVETAYLNYSHLSIPTRVL